MEFPICHLNRVLACTLMQNSNATLDNSFSIIMRYFSVTCLQQHVSQTRANLVNNKSPVNNVRTLLEFCHLHVALYLTQSLSEALLRQGCHLGGLQFVY